eukprot:scaffold11567_cov31-Tisochrysis_lutea.AAC.7
MRKEAFSRSAPTASHAGTESSAHDTPGGYTLAAEPGTTSHLERGLDSGCSVGTARSLSTSRIICWSMSGLGSTCPFKCGGRAGSLESIVTKRDHVSLMTWNAPPSGVDRTAARRAALQSPVGRPLPHVTTTGRAESGTATRRSKHLCRCGGRGSPARVRGRRIAIAAAT